jgi:hypothetical protein
MELSTTFEGDLQTGQTKHGHSAYFECTGTDRCRQTDRKARLVVARLFPKRLLRRSIVGDTK